MPFAIPTSIAGSGPRPSATRARRILLGLALAATLLAAPFAGPARAAPSAGAWLVFDARTGEVIARHNADQAWYPASITKLMTTWVTLKAIRAGRLSLASPVVMTARASREPPSKMGFKPGESVTVDNALKIIMVKSANDVAWALGETVGGSAEGFVAMMNAEAARLGMRQTHWGNPNGLPDPTQITTARDLALLARALLHEFPEADDLWHLPGIQIGNEVIRNHNHLVDHFPGTDGMKTGFICSSGFNVVASASRDSRRLVAVVLGSRSARSRAELAAELFTRGFERGDGGLFARFTAPETLEQMARGPEAANPVRDVKQEICGKKRKDTPDVEDLGEEPSAVDSRNAGRVITPGSTTTGARRVSYLTPRFDVGPPVRVWVGGVEAAPPDAGGMLALAPAPGAPAPIPMMVPATPGAFRAAAPGAVGNPQSFALFRNDGGRSMPPTGPASGAGLEAVLPPADGAPMRIGLPDAPGAARAVLPPPAARPVAPPPRSSRAKPVPPPPPTGKDVAKRLADLAKLAPPKKPAITVPTPARRPKPAAPAPSDD